MKTSILIGILACTGAACTAYAIVKRKQAVEAAKKETKSVDFGNLFGDEEGDAVEASTGRVRVNIPEDDANNIFDSLENIMNTISKNIRDHRTKLAQTAAETAEQKASAEDEAAVMNWINDPGNPFDETPTPDTSADVNAPEDAVKTDSNKDTKSDNGVDTFEKFISRYGVEDD